MPGWGPLGVAAVVGLSVASYFLAATVALWMLSRVNGWRLDPWIVVAPKRARPQEMVAGLLSILLGYATGLNVSLSLAESAVWGLFVFFSVHFVWWANKTGFDQWMNKLANDPTHG